MRRSIVMAGSATCIAVVAGVALAGVADASTSTGVITRPTTSYSSPSNVSVPVRSLAQGTHVDAVCFTEGQTIDGNHNWFRIIGDGGSSYVHRSAISADPDLRHC
jgi:hypothetical protein